MEKERKKIIGWRKTKWSAFRKRTEFLMTNINGHLVIDIERIKMWKRNIWFYLEPIQAVRPKVSQADELSKARVDAGDSLSLICPVQSYPVSLFR